MKWQFQHGDWLLKSNAGKTLGHVYRTVDGWCAETELNGLTTAPGEYAWAIRTLWNFCLVQYPEKTHELTHADVSQ